MNVVVVLITFVLIPLLVGEGYHALVALLAVTLGAYVVVLINEGKRIELRLQGLGAGRKKGAVPRLLTSAGELLEESIRAAALRFENLEWEVVSTAKLRELPTGVVSQNEGEDLYVSPGDPSFVPKILKLAREYFRAAGIAVLYPQRGGQGVSMLGIQGRKISAYVEYFAAQYRERLGVDAPLLIDLSQNVDTLGNFKTFGLQSAILARLSDSAGDLPEVLLWLGYPSQFSAGTREVGRVLEFCQRMRHDLVVLSRMQSLERQADEATQGSRAQGEFMAQLSHDIRSPLNNVKAILNLMRAESGSEGDRGLLDTAARNCNTVGELVEGILEYTKCKSTKLEPHPTVVSAKELVQQVVDEFSVTAQLRGIELIIEDRVPGALLTIDRHHLKRVLSNLVSNALKYSDHGRVCLRVLQEGRAREVTLQVEDSGRGMSEAQCAQLFTPFVRFDRTESSGMGLGLVVCKMLTETNHGTITVNSQVGLGTTVSLVLPAERGALVREIGQEHWDLSILLVDDDSDYCQTFRRALEGYQIRVITASSVQEGVGLALAANPDLIVSDGSFGAHALGVQDLVEGLAVQGVHAPVVLVSGRELPQSSPLQGRLAAVFSKPVEFELLVEFAHRVVTERRMVA